LSNLALEAEAAITILPTHEQEHIRYQVAHSLQKLYKQQNEEQSYRQNEYKTINQIKRKLSDAKAIITKADKGNSTIVIYEIDYNTIVQNFITNNNFTQLTHDVTRKLQRNIRTAINHLTLNGQFSGRTAPLTYRCCIFLFIQ
jgi:Tfp pilus assembly pilus retraction ATPase PilT